MGKLDHVSATVPCYACDFDTENESMGYVGIIADKIIYQCSICKMLEVRDYVKR